jgi:hypothetical protein
MGVLLGFRLTGEHMGGIPAVTSSYDEEFLPLQKKATEKANPYTCFTWVKDVRLSE